MVEVEQERAVQNQIVHDTDAITYALTYALRQMGLALHDEATLRDIAEIVARPREV